MLIKRKTLYTHVLKQCPICGHSAHDKFKCTCGTDLFTPYPFRLKQRNCTCPEDTERNPV